MVQEIHTTKQRILDEALTLFSVKGYEPVTVAEIAEAVGIKAPSLYKHYKSKQDIFAAIIDEMDTRYEQQAALLRIDGREAEKDKEFYVNINEDELVDMGTKLFLYFLHDEYVCKFRKMLTIEQYGNKDISTLYAKRYIDEPLSYQRTVFDMLTGVGVLVPENPNIIALHYYSPIFMMLALCDCQPDRETEALQMIDQHIRQFVRLYGNTNNEKEGIT